jgi:hypothetical protein
MGRFFPQKKDLDVIYEGQNLIPNGDIEILHNGQPVRWNYQGKCEVGSPGFQSDHALTMAISVGLGCRVYTIDRPQET